MQHKTHQFIALRCSKIAAVIFLIINALWVNAQCCTYTLNMHDSYGDGWNGGYLQVYINNGLVGNFSASNYASTDTFSVCNGDTLQLLYTAGQYDNENTYQLFDAGWNTVFAGGPTPETGYVFTATENCLGTPIPGNNPCTAIPLDTGQCILANNTGFPTSGLNPGCADYQGADVWFTMQVPPSGNLSFITDGGNINDTGVAVWTGNSCANLSRLGCDDDAGNGYYSFLTLFDLTPNETLYIQVYGYGGGTGSFQICANDLGIVSFDSSELPIVVIHTLGQTIAPDNKVNCLMDIKYNGPNQITYVTDNANVYSGNIGIEIRGATSSGYPQPAYGLETRTADGANNDVAILGMPEENDWVLLSNYNDRSLIRNALAYRIFGDMGNYSVRTRLCEVLVDSSYKGIYVLGEKIKRDKNRVDIAKLSTADIAGDDLTGGYILQQNYWDGNNSFQSNYSPVDHPGFDVHFVYEYPSADSITTDQKSYIASYVDSLETALYSPDFADTTTGYRKYLDVKSFIDYFLVNELSRNNDGFKKSVFFNKDKYSNGGKLKAGPVWDFDWAWKNMATCVNFENPDGSGWAHLINDCPTDNYSTGWYVRLLQDSTFNNELRCTYEDYRHTILDTINLFAYIDSVRDLVQHAQARHFQRWPLLGMSGQAPEPGPFALTYNAELDTLKAWISVRLAWLDTHIPGLCVPVTSGTAQPDLFNKLRYYPNPGNGDIHFEGFMDSNTPLVMTIYDVAGKIIDQKALPAGRLQLDYQLKEKGVYFFSVSNHNGALQYGKLMVL